LKQNSLAIGLKLGQVLAFSCMYAAIKLAGNVPIGEVVFFRGFFALVPLFIWTCFTVGPRAAIRTERPLVHVVRGAVGVAAMFTNFTALALLPLVTVTAFGFMQPIFAVVLAAIMLKERAGPWRWAAVLIGFAGVMLMIQPHGGMAGLLSLKLTEGVFYALAFTLLSAFIVVWIRQMSATERSEAIVFYFMSACAVAGLIVMAFDYQPLAWTQIALLVSCGLFGGMGQVLMTYSYRFGEPSLLAPFDYTAMVWAMLLGWFVLGEHPEAMVLAGAAVVIASGLLIAWREYRHHVKMPNEQMT
jgi:drug/metabolite transporter (DMT)-like permease